MRKLFHHFTQSASTSLRWLLVVGAVGVFCVTLTPPAVADSQDAQAANLAVDLVVQAGELAGVPITPDEVNITKQIVTCAVGGVSADDCAKNMAVATLLNQMGGSPELTTAANCLIGGGKASTCLANTLVQALPVEAQPMVGCVVNGGSLADCTAKFAEGQILAQVPDAARPIAECMVEGSQSPTQCVTKFVVSQVASSVPGAQDALNCLAGADPKSCAVPTELQPLVTCATQPGASLQKCAADFAASKLPPGSAEAQAVACLGDKAVAACATGAAAAQISDAEKQAVQNALNLINALNPDAPPVDLSNGMRNGAAQHATLQNIMQVADGIKTGNWGEILIGGGPVVAEAAANALMAIVLDPTLAAALAPAVNAIIQNDADAAKEMFQALANGDGVGMAEVAFKWYETQYFQAGCGLIPDGDVKSAVCGTAADTINFLADQGGDIAKAILGAGKDLLQWLGLWNTIDDTASSIFNDVKSAIDDLGHLLGLGGSDPPPPPAINCGTPSDYYASHYLNSCLGGAASQAAAHSLDTSQLDKECEDWFNQCTNNKDAVAKTCQAMGASLRSVANKVVDSLEAAAAAYTKIGAVSFASHVVSEGFGADGIDLCSPTFWQDTADQYADTCAKVLNANFRPPAPSPIACPIGGSVFPTVQACRDAILGMSATERDLAGPNSVFCKMQLQKLAHPRPGVYCNLVPLKRIFLPSGEVDINMYECHDLFIALPSWMTPKDFGLFLKPPPQQITAVKLWELGIFGDDGSLLRKQAALLEETRSPPGGKPKNPHNNAKLIVPNVGLGPLKRGPVTSAPLAKPAAAATEITRLPPGAPVGSGNGGANKAMDILSNEFTKGNLAGVGGSGAGGPGGGAATTLRGPMGKGTGYGGPGVVEVPKTPGSGPGSGGYSTVKGDTPPNSASKATGGAGSGGFSTVKGDTPPNSASKAAGGAGSGGHGGFNTVKGDVPLNSANSNAVKVIKSSKIPFDKLTKPANNPTNNPPAVDYGGCAKCGSGGGTPLR